MVGLLLLLLQFVHLAFQQRGQYQLCLHSGFGLLHRACLHIHTRQHIM